MASVSVRQDISALDGFFVGEDKALRTTIYDSTKALQDITGWTIQWTLRTAQGVNPPVVTKTATLTSPTAGVCTVQVGAADTSTLATTSTYWHELARTDTGSNTVLCYGNVALQGR